MYKKKFSTVCLLIIFLINFPVFSQELHSDAVFQKITTTYTLHEDGTVRADFYQQIKLLTTQAVSRLYGESSIFYNPEFQKLTIDKSETTMADGTVVPTPENGYNEVLPRAVHHAPGYAFLREMVVSHTGLERGAVIELQYHIDTDADFLPWLMAEEIFRKDSPVKSYTVTVRIPQEKTLHYNLLNHDLYPDIKNENGFSIFTWKLKDCDALLREDNHQDFAEFAPRLLFSTCDKWETIINYMKQSLQSKYTLSETSTPVLLQDIPSLNSDDRILALQNNIAQNISNTDLDLSLLGYRAASAEKTFQRNHGTVLDKAILLKFLLSSQEINADIALVSHYEQFCKQVPSLNQFSRVRVIASTADNDYFILDPYQTQTSRGQIELAGKTLLGLGDEDRKLMKVKKLNIRDNHTEISGILSLDKNLCLKGDITLSISGAFYPYYTLLDNDKGFLSRVINSILPGSNIDEFSIVYKNEDKAEFKLSINNKNAFAKIGDSSLHESFSLNSVLDNWRISSSYFNRTTPLELPAPANEHILLVLNIPENITLSSQEKNHDYSCDKGHIMYRIIQKNNKIIMERQVTVKDKVIQPSEYSDFRTLLVNLEAEDHRSFVIEVE